MTASNKTLKMTDVSIIKMPSPDKTTDYSAEGNTRLKLQVTPTGNKTFYLVYPSPVTGKRTRFRLGRHRSDLSVAAAEKAASIYNGQIAVGRCPQAEKRDTKQEVIDNTIEDARLTALVFRTYLDSTYYPSAKQQKSFYRTRSIIEYNFDWLMDTRIDEIVPMDIERWKNDKRKAGTNPSTVNRALTCLKAALNFAVNVNLIDKSPIKAVKPAKGVSKGVVRFLSEGERARLDAALAERNGHLPVIVRMLLNTGMRPSECFQLTWDDISFTTGLITIHAAYTKTNTTRHIPMRDSLRSDLRRWQTVCGSDTWVFPSPFSTGHIVSIQDGFARLLSEANITHFRLYDLRHDFASQLAMKGVPIPAIAELLGHSNYNQTKVYAHLSGDHLKAAVEMLA